MEVDKVHKKIEDEADVLHQNQDQYLIETIKGEIPKKIINGNKETYTEWLEQKLIDVHQIKKNSSKKSIIKFFHFNFLVQPILHQLVYNVQ